jgi:hypothetical protein
MPLKRKGLAIVDAEVQTRIRDFIENVIATWSDVMDAPQPLRDAVLRHICDSIRFHNTGSASAADNALGAAMILLFGIGIRQDVRDEFSTAICQMFYSNYN